jgi:hypothetical protein
MRMRLGLTRVALLGLFAALLGLPLPLAQASCVGPLLGVGNAIDDARPPTSGELPVRGEDVIVSGIWFGTGCEDTGTTGCSVPVTVDREAPMRDVDLVLEQGSSTWVLGTQNASDEEDSYRITWAVKVPADAQAGPATLRAGGAELPVEISERP